MRKYIEPALHLLFWILLTISYFQSAVNNVRIIREIETTRSKQKMNIDSSILTVDYMGNDVFNQEIITDTNVITSPTRSFSKDVMISNYKSNVRTEAIRFYDKQIITLLTLGNIPKALLFYGIALLLIPKWLARQKWRLFVGLLVILIIGTFGLETLFDAIYLHYRGQVIYPDGITPDNFRNILNFNFRLYSIILISAFTYRFTKDWIYNKNVEKKLTEEKLITELKFLKAQIHPHFLFNTLNNLYGMALADQSERTAEGIAKLAQQMRYMLYESNVELIDLEKELNYIQTFINLQQLRLTEEDDIRIEFKQSGDLSGKQIAPMLLIPFVENAFKHSLTFNKKTEIIIHLEVINNQLQFYISNTINPYRTQQEESASGLGLQNVMRRLELLYPNRHELKIEQEANNFIVYLNLIV